MDSRYLPVFLFIHGQWRRIYAAQIIKTNYRREHRETAKANLTGFRRK
jgi:hypothetical protein